MSIVRWIILAASALVTVVMWWSYAKAELGEHPASGVQATKYHCPMHPQIVSNDPGECPICHMTLEPIAESHSGAPSPTTSAGKTSMAPKARRSGTEDAQPAAPKGGPPPGTAPIVLSFDRIQAIGVRTALVDDVEAVRTVRATAIVEPTEQGAAEVHVRSPGFVERIAVGQTGVQVSRGQLLFAYYSPEILQAEHELLAARQWEATASPNRAGDSARSKLSLLGMSDADIDAILKTASPVRATPVYAPRSGYVSKKGVTLGSYVTPDMTLYDIQDLSQVYVIADVYQQDVGLLDKGQTGRFARARNGDETIDAKIDLIYPTLNAEARTTRVRMQVQNPKTQPLRPGEFGTVTFATAGHRALSVPRDAVVDTGTYTYVFVAQDGGRFSPHEVVLGDSQGERFTVLGGVSAGDRVVSGATFLIDSESRLQASAAKLGESDPPMESH